MQKEIKTKTLRGTRIGTCHFASIYDARGYYGNEEAKRKIKSGEIALGQPKVKEDEKLLLIEGRYFLEIK